MIEVPTPNVVDRPPGPPGPGAVAGEPEAAVIARGLAVKLAAEGVSLVGCLRAPFVRAVIRPRQSLVGIDVAGQVQETGLAHPGHDLHAAAPGAWPEGLEAALAGTVPIVSLAWTAEPGFRRRLVDIAATVPAIVIADPDGTAGLDALAPLLERLQAEGLRIAHRCLVRPREDAPRESPLVMLAGTAGETVGELLAAGARGLALDPLVDIGTRLERSPRICVASYEVIGPTRNGGIGTANTSLAQALAAAGHDVTLLYTGPESAVDATARQQWAHRYARDDVRFEVLAAPERPVHVPHYNARRSYELFQWLARHDRDRPFDVVHFPECQGHGYYAVLAKRAGTAFANTTFVVGVHSSTRWCAEANDELPRTLDFLVDEHLERRSVELADVLISPSAYMIDYLRERGWTLPERRFAQQYVVPLTTRRRPGVPPPAPAAPPRELVFFGRLEVRKGLRTFCDAIDLLAESALPADLRISFLGRPEHIAGEPATEYVRRRAAGWKCPVEVLGEMAHPDAIAYLRRRDCIAVMPSTVDNSPNTVSETVSLGIPVLASRSGGTGELLDPLDLARHTFPGIVPRTGLPPAPAERAAGEMSAGALAERIRDLLSNPGGAPRFAVEHERGLHVHVGWNAGAAELARRGSPVAPADAADLPSVGIGVLHRNDPDGLMYTLASLIGEAGAGVPVTAVDLDSRPGDTQDRLAWAEELCRGRGWTLERLGGTDGGDACQLVAARCTSEMIAVLRAGEAVHPGMLRRVQEVAARCSADIVTWAARRLDLESGSGDRAEATVVPIDGPAIAGLFYPAFTAGGFAIRRSALDRLPALPDVTGDESLQVLVNEAVVAGMEVVVVPDELTQLRTPDGWSPVRAAFAVQYGQAPRSRSEDLRVARTFRRCPQVMPDAAALLLAASRDTSLASIYGSAEYKALDVRRHEQAEYIAYLEAEHHQLSAEIHKLRRRLGIRVLTGAGRGLRTALRAGRG